MVRIVVVIIFSLMLGGCGQVNKAKYTFSSQQIYNNYPCRDHCHDFQQGYDLAQAQGFTQMDQCSRVQAAQTLGCKAYVNDYQIDYVENGGLKLVLN